MECTNVYTVIGALQMHHDDGDDDNDDDDDIMYLPNVIICSDYIRIS